MYGRERIMPVCKVCTVCPWVWERSRRRERFCFDFLRILRFLRLFSLFCEVFDLPCLFYFYSISIVFCIVCIFYYFSMYYSSFVFFVCFRPVFCVC